MRQSLRIAVRVMLMGSAGMIASQVKAQLKVGKNPTKIEKSAILELESDKQGLLLPRVADTSLMTSLNPPDGMIIYWTQTGKQGFYVRHNYEWEKMSTKSSSWDLLGNYVADAATQFIGSTNPIPFVMKGNNVEGIRIDNGNVTLSNNVTLSGITAGGATLMDAVIVDATGKMFKRSLSKTAFDGLTINGSDVAAQTIKTDNVAGDYAFATNTATGTHTLSIATQDGTTTNLGLLTKADWNKFNAAAGKALETTGFISTGTANGLTVDNSGANPTIALNAATGTTPGGVSTGTQTFGGDKTFTGKITGNNGLAVTAGGAAITGNSSVDGTFHVTGTTTLDDALTITQNGADITGNTKVTGNLHVTANAALDNTVQLNNVAVGTTTDYTVLMLNAAKEVISRNLPATAFTDLTFASDHAGTDLDVVKDATTNKVTVSIPLAAPTVTGGLVGNVAQSFVGAKKFGDEVSVKKNVIIGDTINAANSTLQVAGSVSMPINVVTGSYTVNANDYTVIVKSSTSATVTLPSASGLKGRIYTIKKVATNPTVNNLDNAVTIKAAGSEFIEDGNSIDIFNDWTFVTVQSDGSNTWYIIKK